MTARLSRFVFALALAGSVVIAGCGGGDGDGLDTDTLRTDTTAATDMQQETATARLEPTQGNNVTGTVTFTALGGDGMAPDGRRMSPDDGGMSGDAGMTPDDGGMTGDDGGMTGDDAGMTPDDGDMAADRGMMADGMSANRGVRIEAEIRGLAPGSHGFHIHENGDCSAPDASSAGGHFNPTGEPHGAPDDSVRHVGDLGNLEADSDSTASYSRVDTVITLTGANSIVGKAVVVHANDDDLTSQPSGDAGDRVACGVIESDGAAGTMQGGRTDTMAMRNMD